MTIKSGAMRSGQAQRRDGPRKVEQIFTTTLRLLSEKGYDNLSVEGIASDAGVNKTTIYRWWPSKDALLAAALIDSDLLYFDMPDTGSLRHDLLALAEHVTELLTAHTEIVTAIFAAAHRRPELATLLHQFFADRLIREQPIFQRAVQRGELPGSIDPKTVMDLLAGAIWLRVLARGETIPSGHLVGVVDQILNGISRTDSD